MDCFWTIAALENDDLIVGTKDSGKSELTPLNIKFSLDFGRQNWSISLAKFKNEKFPNL